MRHGKIIITEVEATVDTQAIIGLLLKSEGDFRIASIETRNKSMTGFEKAEAYWDSTAPSDIMLWVLIPSCIMVELPVPTVKLVEERTTTNMLDIPSSYQASDHV